MNIFKYKIFFIIMLLSRLCAPTVEGMTLDKLMEEIPTSLPKPDKPFAGSIYAGCRAMTVDWKNFPRFEWCVSYFVKNPKEVVRNKNFIAKANEWLHYIKQKLKAEIENNKPLMNMLMFYADTKTGEIIKDISILEHQSETMIDPLDTSSETDSEMGLSSSQLAHESPTLRDMKYYEEKEIHDFCHSKFPTLKTLPTQNVMLRLENTVAETVKILQSYKHYISEEKSFGERAGSLGMTVVEAVIQLGEHVHSGIEALINLCSCDDLISDGVNIGDILFCLLNIVLS